MIGRQQDEGGRFIILSGVPLSESPETLINRLVRNATFDKMAHFVES
jgi:hypothetical protein